MTTTLEIKMSDDAVVEYFTDVEGNWDYFTSILERSKVLRKDGAGEWILVDDGYIVHGGDACDKGSGDIRIIKLLTKLKRQYPDRVFLILGNRDTNKLRFGSEMAEAEVNDTVKEGIGYWDAKLKPFTEWLAAEEGREPGALTTLQWMLECTMGCQTTYESRRTELSILGGHESRDAVTDQEVLDSFVESVNPAGSDPWMLDYIKLGQFSALINDTLFVHGGVSMETIGAVPGVEQVQTDLREWLRELDLWKVQQCAAYEETQTWEPAVDSESGGSGKRTRSGNAIMDYCVPGGNGGKTVVYTAMKSFGERPEDKRCEKFLMDAGVSRVVVGHQPQGDCPHVMRCKSGLDIFMCDTSYSDMTKANHPTDPDNRGKAISMIWIRDVSTVVEGTLSSGQKHGYTLLNMKPPVPHVIGRHVDNGFVVRTIVEDQTVIAYRFEGFKKLTKEWPSITSVPAALAAAEEDV